MTITTLYSLGTPTEFLRLKFHSAASYGRLFINLFISSRKIKNKKEFEMDHFYGKAYMAIALYIVSLTEVSKTEKEKKMWCFKSCRIRLGFVQLQ